VDSSATVYKASLKPQLQTVEFETPNVSYNEIVLKEVVMNIEYYSKERLQGMTYFMLVKKSTYDTWLASKKDDDDNLVYNKVKTNDNVIKYKFHELPSKLSWKLPKDHGEQDEDDCPASFVGVMATVVMGRPAGWTDDFVAFEHSWRSFWVYTASA
jgi:hypothetical protein